MKLCVRCVASVERAGKTKHFCPTCKSTCKSIKEDNAERTKMKDMESISFWKSLPNILRYPIRKQSLPLILIGAVMFMAAEFAASTYIFSPVLHILMAVFIVGYLFLYMQKVIVATPNAEEDLPAWPDFSDPFDDILFPMGQLAGTFLASFGPYLAYMIYHATSGTDMNMGILFPLFVWGMLYLIALLAVAMADSVMAANPLVVLPSITRIAGQYLFGCALFFTLVSIRYVVARLIHIHFDVPIISTAITSFIALYLLTVEMRMLGVMYYLNRRRLRWFKH